jgi:DNA-binding CsgD family transcriptional regulator
MVNLRDADAQSARLGSPAMGEGWRGTPSVRRQRFSPRESEIVRLIALGLEDKEIANTLGISRRTVRTHLERLFEDLDVHSRAAAVYLWLGSGVARDEIAPVGDDGEQAEDDEIGAQRHDVRDRDGLPGGESPAELRVAIGGSENGDLLKSARHHLDGSEHAADHREREIEP